MERFNTENLPNKEQLTAEETQAQLQEVRITVETQPTQQLEESPELEKDGKATKDEVKTKRANASEVWNHFTKLSSGNRAQCLYCKNLYACHPRKNGTSTVRAHMKVCKKSPFVQADKKQKTLSFFQKPGQPEGNVGELKVVQWTKDGYRKVVARYLVLDELPFRQVEGNGFKEYSRYMNPQFFNISRITIARDIMKLYAEEKQNLKKLVKHQRISITMDCWTSIQNINYMCVTAHWIDENWQLQKRIIAFFQVGNHKGDTVAQELTNCFNDLGITKIMAVAMDNATSNDVAIDKLKRKMKQKIGSLVQNGNLLHIRCVCHIVNLIVRDGLKLLSSSIATIRNAVRYVRSSPSRLKRFSECAEAEGVLVKALLCLDVPTRWNSTYLMLDAALKYQKAFERLEDDLNYKSYFGEDLDGPPTEADWENAGIFVRFLKTFYDITVRLSGTSYVTSNLMLADICDVKYELDAIMGDSSSVMFAMASKMKDKFDKYWGDPNKVNLVVFLGAVFDPRYKMAFVEHCLIILYGKEVAKIMSTRIEGLLQDLLQDYGDNSNLPQLNGQPMKVRTGPQSSRVIAKFLMSESETDTASKNDVDRYLGDAREKLTAGNFDVLRWWHVNANKYEVLSKIAKDVLAVPMSTVASESAFSTSGRILDSYRSSLTPKTVESLICLKSWISQTHAAMVLTEFMDEIDSLQDSILAEEPEVENQ